MAVRVDVKVVVVSSLLVGVPQPGRGPFVISPAIFAWAANVRQTQRMFAQQA
jgi:hypothetical protein